VISVRDRGNGVPEEALEKIFRPFYRAEDARDRQSGGGTGLGLAITERAVRMHGGSISAHNAADGGLSVEMRLKL
jgi:two-component system sensor histidine kinase CpxA